MKPASQYRYTFQYQPMTRTLDTATGDNPKAWDAASTVFYFGSEDLTSGQFEKEFGAERHRAIAQIRLRGFPTVNPQDRLFGGRFDTLYVIDGIHLDRANWETVVEVHSLEIDA